MWGLVIRGFGVCVFDVCCFVWCGSVAVYVAICVGWI